MTINKITSCIMAIDIIMLKNDIWRITLRRWTVHRMTVDIVTFGRETSRMTLGRIENRGYYGFCVQLIKKSKKRKKVEFKTISENPILFLSLDSSSRADIIKLFPA